MHFSVILLTTLAEEM